jgi:phosphate starvation-inducible PhoH-like protein
MTRKRHIKQELALPEAAQPNHAGKFTIELKNQWQKELWDTIHKQESRLVFIEGEAGSGKTHIATAACCNAYLTKRTRKIHLVRPYVNAFESYGYLKGTLEDKLLPMLMPILDIVETMGGDKKKFEEALQYEAFGFMRGRTFNNWVIADEQQSSTYEMLKLLTTRIGRGCKMLVTFDPSQCDIKQQEITKFIDDIRHVKGVVHYRLPPEAQVREPIVQDILASLNKKVTD